MSYLSCTIRLSAKPWVHVWGKEGTSYTFSLFSNDDQLSLNILSRMQETIVAKFELQSIMKRSEEILHCVSQTKDLLSFYDSINTCVTLLQTLSKSVRTRNNKFQATFPSPLFVKILEWLPSLELLRSVCKAWFQKIRAALKIRSM